MPSAKPAEPCSVSSCTTVERMSAFSGWVMGTWVKDVFCRTPQHRPLLAHLRQPFFQHPTPAGSVALGSLRSPSLHLPRRGWVAAARKQFTERFLHRHTFTNTRSRRMKGASNSGGIQQRSTPPTGRRSFKHNSSPYQRNQLVHEVRWSNGTSTLDKTLNKTSYRFESIRIDSLELKPDGKSLFGVGCDGRELHPPHALGTKNWLFVGKVGAHGRPSGRPAPPMTPPALRPGDGAPSSGCSFRGTAWLGCCASRRRYGLCARGARYAVIDRAGRTWILPGGLGWRSTRRPLGRIGMRSEVADEETGSESRLL